MKAIKKVLIRNNKHYYWKEGDLHTDAGLIKEEDLEKDTSEVKSHIGKEFLMFKPSFLDNIRKIIRGPQTLLDKDLAIITFYSGIDKNSKVLDAGSGCGLLAICLARIAKEVVTYDRNKKHIKLTKKNIEFLNIKNIEVKEKDIYEGIDEQDLDLVTLDLPEPWHALDHVHNALKNGSYLATYLPTITQVKELVSKAEEKFFIEKTVEILEREWIVEGRKVRPKSHMQGHTAFITILRKI
ncbi:MAG: methyltransferase domain-containing protein [Nanoarchaeota archaeon]|nr:methyltransferase domain-containing protein [Nanoarchaeota archaeon]